MPAIPRLRPLQLMALAFVALLLPGCGGSKTDGASLTPDSTCKEWLDLPQDVRADAALRITTEVDNVSSPGNPFWVGQFTTVCNQLPDRSLGRVASDSYESGASEGGAGEEPSNPAATTDLPGASEAAQLYDGIPQSGSTIGDPSAPATLRVYCDYQAPFCAELFKTAIPRLVADRVRTGKLRLDLQTLSFIGPDSERAAGAAQEAAAAGRLWQYSSIFFDNQGQENTGYVTADFLSNVAGAAGVPLAANGPSAASDETVKKIQAAAETAGVVSAPAFAIKTAGGGYRSLDQAGTDLTDIESAIDQAVG